MQRPAWTPGRGAEPRPPPPLRPRPAASSWPETQRCARLPPAAWGERERQEIPLDQRKWVYVLMKTKKRYVILLT